MGLSWTKIEMGGAKKRIFFPTNAFYHTHLSRIISKDKAIHFVRKLQSNRNSCANDQVLQVERRRVLLTVVPRGRMLHISEKKGERDYAEGRYLSHYTETEEYLDTTTNTLNH
jgi:hypothetical protein